MPKYRYMYTQGQINLEPNINKGDLMMRNCVRNRWLNKQTVQCGIIEWCYSCIQKDPRRVLSVILLSFFGNIIWYDAFSRTLWSLNENVFGKNTSENMKTACAFTFQVQQIFIHKILNTNIWQCKLTNLNLLLKVLHRKNLSCVFQSCICSRKQTSTLHLPLFHLHLRLFQLQLQHRDISLCVWNCLVPIHSAVPRSPAYNFNYAKMCGNPHAPTEKRDAHSDMCMGNAEIAHYRTSHIIQVLCEQDVWNAHKQVSFGKIHSKKRTATANISYFEDQKNGWESVWHALCP